MFIAEHTWIKYKNFKKDRRTVEQTGSQCDENWMEVTDNVTKVTPVISEQFRSSFWSLICQSEIKVDETIVQVLDDSLNNLDASFLETSRILRTRCVLKQLTTA